MKIGLIDVDNFKKKTIAFPNMPLMKISAYHKALGDSVVPWMACEKYDIVYKSKIFPNSPEIEYTIYADVVIAGGTGYAVIQDIDGYVFATDYASDKLPPEVESVMPDYSLYPQFNEAYGFLTRGCPRSCPFCIVSKKEGFISVKVADLDEFWSGQNMTMPMDKRFTLITLGL